MENENMVPRPLALTEIHCPMPPNKSKLTPPVGSHCCVMHFGFRSHHLGAVCMSFVGGATTLMHWQMYANVLRCLKSFWAKDWQQPSSTAAGIAVNIGTYIYFTSKPVQNSHFLLYTQTFRHTKTAAAYWRNKRSQKSPLQILWSLSAKPKTGRFSAGGL